MLKPEDLSDGIGLVEEKILEESETERQRLELRLQRRRKRLMQGTGIAAVLALCTAVGIGSHMGKMQTAQSLDSNMAIADTDGSLSGGPAEENAYGAGGMAGNSGDTTGEPIIENSVTELLNQEAAAMEPKTIVSAVYPEHTKNPHMYIYDPADSIADQEEVSDNSQGESETGKTEIMEIAASGTSEGTGEESGQKQSVSFSEASSEKGDLDDSSEEAMSYLERLEIWWQEKTDRKEAAQKVGNELSDCTEKLLSQLFIGADGENRAFSPVNLYLGLGMLAEITNGTSREQVLSLLGTSDMDSLRETADALWESTWQDDGVVTARLAGSLWLDQRLNYRQEAMEQLAAVYRTSSFQGTMGSASYNELFHQWLNEQTGNLLQKQAEGLELDPDTILCMAATIYYKAPWEEKFLEANNTREIFHGAKKDEEAVFMHQKGNRSYVKGDHYQAVVQKIQEDGSLLLILPDEGVELDALLQEKEVQELMTGRKLSMEEVSVNLSLPQFDIVSDLDMIEDLKALGVTAVFDPETSDFSPIIKNPEAALSVFQHAARITADEKGVEAAAYTIMELKEAAEIEMEKTVEMKLDRPFLMVIRDDNGLPLFMGMVNQVK